MSSVGSPGSLPPDVLVGDGCYLRALSVTDWAIEQALSRDSDVVRWTYYPVELTEDESRHRIQDSLERTGVGLLRRYVVVEGGTPVGTCGIAGLDGDCPHIYYALLPGGRGRGIATSAARLLVEWALTSGYAVVSLETIQGNQASERVATKAGFRPVDRYHADHRGETAWLTRWTIGAAD